MDGPLRGEECPSLALEVVQAGAYRKAFAQCFNEAFDELGHQWRLRPLTPLFAARERVIHSARSAEYSG